MLLSWRRALVSDWVTLFQLPLKLLLALHLLLLALPSIYLWSIKIVHFLSFWPSSFSTCLSVSCYCHHLFTQPVVLFLPSLMSYSQILSDIIRLVRERGYSVHPPNYSEPVVLLVSELWQERARTSMHAYMWAFFIYNAKITITQLVTHSSLWQN